MKMFKRIIIYLVAILCFNCCTDANKGTTLAKSIPYLRECEVITVYCERTRQVLFTDTLANNRIMYSEKSANGYAFKNIPSDSLDISEKYIIHNEYFNKGEKTYEDWHMMYFYSFAGDSTAHFFRIEL